MTLIPRLTDVCARKYDYVYVCSMARKHCYKCCGFPSYVEAATNHYRATTATTTIITIIIINCAKSGSKCRKSFLQVSGPLLRIFCFSSYYCYFFFLDFLVLFLPLRCHNVFSLRNIRPSPIMAASFSLSNRQDRQTGAQKGFWAHAESNLKSEQADEKSSLTRDLYKKLYQSKEKSIWEL